jgi:colanic acid biosynthesis glycosyl transferase WcaI
MLAATDIALITQQRIVSNIVFPSKIVTLFCAGCPVVASVNFESEVARTVERSGAGLVVEAENAGLLLGAIDRLSQSKDLRAQMGASAQQFAYDSWDERRTLPQMEAQFTECVQRWRDSRTTDS